MRISAALRAYALATCYFAGASLLVFYLLLKPGYVLSLDMIFAPGVGYVDFLLYTKGPLYYGRLPFLVLLDALSVALRGWVVQKLVLCSLPIACGLSAYAACRAETRPGRLYAGTVYALNPFVYVRLLAGHWYFLLGYAFLPLAVVRAYRHFDPDSDGDLLSAVGWATVVSVFDPHATILLAIAGGALAVALLVREGQSDLRDRLSIVGRQFATYVAGCAAVNAYWLLPAVRNRTRLAMISGADLVVFSARGTIAGNVPLSIGMLYGFWRPGYSTTPDLLSPVVAYALFATIVYLAVSGAVRSRDRAFVTGIALFTLVGFVLALGVSTSGSEPVVRFAFETVPVLRGMRDSQKFVGLLALTYALFGGRGVDHLYATVRDRCTGGRHGETRPVNARLPSGRRLVSIGVVLLVLAVPAAYAVPMFGGFAGQLDTTRYPDDWHAADEYLAGDPGSYRVLVLPWHQYVQFTWTDDKVANPAELFFNRRTIVSHDVEIGGIESRATDPTHSRSRRAVAAFNADRLDPSGFAERLAPLGVKYVFLTHDADYRRYADLDRDSGFTVAFRSREVTLFENNAFEPRVAGGWPRAGPPVPWESLGIGTAVSALASALVVHRHRSVTNS